MTALRTKLMDLSKEQLVDTIISLQKELAKYKNSNTPSSANKHLKPNTQNKKVKGNSKRGAPIGHIGKTRNQIPQRKEIIDTDECPFCRGHHLLMNLVLNYFWWSRLFNFLNYLFVNFTISKMMSTAKLTFISINNLLSLGNLISSFSNMAYWRPSFRISFNFFVLRVCLQILVCRRGSV